MPEGELIIPVEIWDTWTQVDKKGIQVIYMLVYLLGEICLFSKKDIEGEEWKQL